MILTCLSFGQLNAQTVLIKQNVPEDFSTIDDNKGPNRKSFSYPFFGIGWHVGELSLQENDTVLSPKYPQSFEAKFGTRYRLKVNKLIGLGFDWYATISNHNMSIKDDYIQTTSPPSIQKLRYQFISFGAAPHLQFNFKPKRGNQLGAYIDMGAFGDYLLSRRLIMLTENPNSKETTKTSQQNLQDLNKFINGLFVRYGRNSWAFFIKYRHTNSFRYSPTINLPRITIGFEYFTGTV